MDQLALGHYLRETREAREVTLDEAVSVLKIRRMFLESFEQGEFNVIESPVQLRGFLRSYAAYLGLDEERVLDIYDAAIRQGDRGRRLGRRRKRQRLSAPDDLAAPRSITDTQPRMPAVNLSEPAPNRLRTLAVTLLMVVSSLAALAVILYVTVELIRTPGEGLLVQNDDGRQGFIGTLPATATRRPSATPTLPLMLSPTLPPAQEAFSAGQGVLVTIDFAQRSWLRVTVDDDERFAGIVPPGETLEFLGVNQIELEAANAAAIQVTYNGQRQSRYGERGQRVDLLFTTETVELLSAPSFEPTPAVSNTPQPTPTQLAGTLLAQLTPTVTAGPTLTPSETPTASDTPTLTVTSSVTPPPTATPTLTPTVTLTPTPTLTYTPTITYTPSITPTPSPTAILPLRITPAGATPPKSAQGL